MTTTEAVDGVEPVQLAAQVYIYGYRLVYSLSEIDGFANNIASLPFSARYNQFGYARDRLGPGTQPRPEILNGAYILRAIAKAG